MTNREHALFAYFGTIAFDPKVRNAKSFNQVLIGVASCIEEDLPAVLKEMSMNFISFAKNKAKQHLADKMREIAQPGLESTVDQLFEILGSTLGNAMKRTQATQTTQNKRK